MLSDRIADVTVVSKKYPREKKVASLPFRPSLVNESLSEDQWIVRVSVNEE